MDPQPFGLNKTKRYTSQESEKALFQNRAIGNSGSFELVDYMGGDGTVERVATLGHGTEIFKEKPAKDSFIQYLATNRILAPFKSVQAKFVIQSPIEVALNFIYEPNNSVNEYSLRYSKPLTSSFQFETGNKEADKIFSQIRESSLRGYNWLIKKDLARELSRSILGSDQNTRYYIKSDFLSLVGFIKSMEKFSQKFPNPLEDYIVYLKNTLGKIAPLSFDALYNPRRISIDLTFPKDEDIVDSPLSPQNWESSQTKRRTVKNLEEILFSPFQVLDNGEIQAVDYMGDDNSMAEAARTSYGEGTKTLTDNANLVRSLIRDNHTSPIEMAELAFESKAPVFSDPRQFGRHRTLDFHGFMGYFPKGSQIYFPEDTEFKHQDRKNRQGRNKLMEENDRETSKKILAKTFEKQKQGIEKLRKLGISENSIRMSKGVGTFTKTWRTGDVHNLGHYLSLRNDPHAQKEIRVYAEIVDEILAKFVPIAHKSLHTYKLDSIKFSTKEIELLKRNLKKQEINWDNLDNFKGVGFVRKNKETKKEQLSREGETFKQKLRRLLD